MRVMDGNVKWSNKEDTFLYTLVLKCSYFKITFLRYLVRRPFEQTARPSVV